MEIYCPFILYSIIGYIRGEPLKKTVATIIAISICISICIFVICYHNNNEKFIIKYNFGALMNEFLNDAKSNEFENISDFNHIEIYDEVKINTINNKEDEASNLTNLPVVINDKIELIFVITKGRCSYNVSLGRDFAPLLNEMKKNGYDEVYIVQDNFTFYAIFGENVYKQVGQTVTQTNLEDLQFSISSNMEKSRLNHVNQDYTQIAIDSLERVITNQ